jgi:hypothetical protein
MKLEKKISINDLKAMCIKNILSIPDHPDPMKRSILKPKILEALNSKKAGTGKQDLLLNYDD